MMSICNPSMTADSIDVKQLCISNSVVESLKLSHCTLPSHIPTAVATYELRFAAALGDPALPAQLSMLGRIVSTLALLAGEMSVSLHGACDNIVLIQTKPVNVQ